MSVIIIYAFVFGSVLLLVDVILRRLFGARSASREINVRMERLKGGADQLTAFNTLLIDRGVKDKGGLLFSAAGLRKLYRQSGLVLSFQRRIAYVIVIYTAALVGSLVISGDPLVQLACGLVIGSLAIYMIVRRARNRRINKFVNQLPVALEIIVRSLNSGHPLTTAIALVGREMPDPIGSEFGLLSDHLTFGSELDAAMLNMVERVGADELNLLAVTVSVQRSTGGNLSEVLENLATMTRDRLTLRAKIKAVSAEGRITAMVMAIFPVGLFLMIRALIPTYFDPVWESGYGTISVVTIIIVMAIGLFILFRLVRFDF